MHKKGSGWLLMGLILMAAALGLTAYNLWSTTMAGRYAALAAERLAEGMQFSSLLDDKMSDPDYVLNPHMDMPVQEIDGYSYVGLLELPALDLALPIQQQWSYPGLRISPGRYDGSVYLDDMVICGHNYSTHFGGLKGLRAGDRVYFTDIDGNRFSYAVKEIEILAPEAVEEMTSENWDLTLFTCTLGGASRVTVRCSRIAE